MNKAILFFILILALCSPCFAQSNQTESLTITTYYPSPYGVYRNLRLHPSNLPTVGVDRGIMYYDNSSNVIRYHNDTQWVNLTGGGGGTAGGWEYNTTSGHVYNVNTGNIGIGTNNPQEKLHIVGVEDGSFPYQDLVFMEGEGELALTLFSSANDPHQECKIEPYRARGRMSSRSPLLKNDTIFQIDPAGYSGATNGYKSAARIDVLADGDFNTNSGPGRIVFSTTPADDTTAKPVPTERMVIKNDGNVGIGNSDPRCKLHIGLSDFSLPGGSIAPGIADFYKYLILLCSCASAHQSYGLGVMGDGTGLFFNSPYGYTFFRIGTGESPFLTMLPQNSSGTCKRIGIQTRTPTHILDVQGNVNDNANKVNSKQGYLTDGADYAEYFENEESIAKSSLVGLNLKSGKVRAYREGDEFIGIVSGEGAFVGNGDKSDDGNYTLVGLLGQLDFDRRQVNIEGRKVFTKDNKYIGHLLSNNKIFIK